MIMAVSLVRHDIYIYILTIYKHIGPSIDTMYIYIDHGVEGEGGGHGWSLSGPRQNMVRSWAGHWGSSLGSSLGSSFSHHQWGVEKGDVGGGGRRVITGPLLGHGQAIYINM